MKKSNLVIGSILILVSAFVWIYSQVVFPEETAVTVGANFFPRVLSAILSVLAILLMLQRPDGEQWKPSFKDPSFQRVMIAIASCILFTVLLKPVGFILVSCLILVGLMFMLGFRKYWMMAVIALGVSVVVQVLFEHVLGVVLPYGVLAFIFYA